MSEYSAYGLICVEIRLKLKLRACARAATAIATDFLPETQDVLDEEVAGNTLVAASRWPIPLADVSATIQRYVTQEQLLARYGKDTVNDWRSAS